MRLALVDAQRREAQPGLLGKCPGCRSAVIARCGEVNVWHWAYRAGPTYDAGGNLRRNGTAKWCLS